MQKVAALAFFLAAVLLQACESGPQPQSATTAARGVTYGGGNGGSIEDAVVVSAPDHFAGIRAEYAWLAQRYPGFQRRSQALLPLNDRFYDRIEIETPRGERKVLYFDMTAFAPKR